MHSIPSREWDRFRGFQQKFRSDPDPDLFKIDLKS